MRVQECRPVIQHAVRIAAGIPSGSAVESHIDRAARDGAGGTALGAYGHVVQAEADVMLAQQCQDVIGDTRLVPELDDMPERSDSWPVVCRRHSRKRRQERRQPLHVRHPPGRKLIQQRTETCAQVLRMLEQTMQRLGRVLQLLHVCQIAAGFDREQEWRRHPFAPGGERLRRWKAIERVVQLDAVEHARVRLEPRPSRHMCCVEPCAPMRVVPARAADANLARHALRHWRIACQRLPPIANGSALESVGCSTSVPSASTSGPAS